MGSANPPTVHRIIPGILSGQGRPPPRLQPAWLLVGGGVGARPWSCGAAGPSGERRGAACAGSGRRTRHARSGRVSRRRGIRAGQRVQQRRHRANRDAQRRHCADESRERLECGRVLPHQIYLPNNDWQVRQAAPAPVNAAVLVEPPRLTVSQTLRAAAPATAAAPLTLGHLNIRSLTAHLDQLNQLLLTEKLDVICLSETFLNKNVDDRTLIVPGYRMLRRDRSGGSSGGGVAVLLRSDLRAEQLRTPTGGSSLETLWLQVGGRNSVIVGVGYRPPSGQLVPALDDLHEQLTHILASDLPTYLLGDFNIDTLRPAKPGVVPYLQLLHELGLHQLVTAPTRQSENPTLIDHIITNKPQSASGTKVIACNISEHDLISTSVANTRERQQPVTVSVRSTRRVNTDALCLDLLLADWSGVAQSNNITDMWTAFLATWQPIIDLHMPLRTIRLRHQAYPWLQDEEVRAAMATRDRARRARDRAPSEETQQEFRNRRNAVKVTLNRACSAFFEHTYKNSRPKTWKSVRQFLIASGKAQPKTISTSTAGEQWANKLNNYFASLGPSVAASLAHRDTGERLPPRPPRVCGGSFTPRPATLPELSSALHCMSSSHAAGRDGITVHMLRTTFAVVGPHLLKLVNTSIVSGELPLDWKAATVTPLYKKGNTADPGNYRPISILPVVAKLAERVVCSQLMHYLSSHHVLCPQQYGFRPGLSTEAALLDTVTYATENLDRGAVTSLITADTSKAFDSVEHGRLLDKLGWYGIETGWLADWLRNRTQTVLGKSESRAITHGVVQGSILGPVLFLLYTNDIVSYMTDAKIVAYADDLQFLDSDTPDNIQSLLARLEHTLSLAHEWFVQNRLQINPDKTEMLFIRSQRKNIDTNFRLQFGDSHVSPSQNVRVLGVSIDAFLTWESHITTVIQKCNIIIISIGRMRNKIPYCTRRLLIEALVIPHIRYCATVWGGCNKTQKRRLQKVLNFAVRIVFGLRKFEHISDSRNQFTWGKLEDIIETQDLSVVKRTLTNPNASKYLREKLVSRADVSSRHTRATTEGMLQLPKVRTEIAKRSFYCRAAAAWNRIITQS